MALTKTCCGGAKTRLVFFGLLLCFLGLVIARDYSARQVFEKRFPVLIDKEPVSVRVAARFTERARGLMDCKQLEPDEGMLFVFSVAARLSFWMKDTPLPLDVGFFDSDGVLFQIQPLVPFDEKVIEAIKPGRYALEVSQGWFARHQLQPGAKLDLEMVRVALSHR